MKKIFSILLIMSLSISLCYAATRAVVPRADQEGSIGTTLKKWATAFFGNLYVEGTSPAVYWNPDTGDTWHAYVDPASVWLLTNYTDEVEAIRIEHDNKICLAPFTGKVAIGRGLGGGAATLDVNGTGLFTSYLTIGAYRLPILDGTDGQVLTTDGAGTVGWETGGGSPTDADYLVGTANGSLSAEIVVGTSPGGELGGTWGSPTVDSGIFDDEYLKLDTSNDPLTDNLTIQVANPYLILDRLTAGDNDYWIGSSSTGQIGIGYTSPGSNPLITFNTNGLIQINPADRIGTGAVNYIQISDSPYIYMAVGGQLYSFTATQLSLRSANLLLAEDNSKAIFGYGNDASIYYDGTNMLINPKEVGTGYLSILGNVNLNANVLIGGTATTDDLILRTTSGIGASGADMIFQVGNNGATEAMRILNSGNVGIGTATPTAVLHLKAGTATASTAPLKLSTGTNLTTPENGAFEYDGTDLFFTTGGVRYKVVLNPT